ncbi:MAG: helix-turn-helix transcriptional regulator [Proteobacteria bacterium]|nr:helix-turn-helix transcriptional regulator [Pseudomonadota bacterium]
MVLFGQNLCAFARDLGLSDAEVARRAGLAERRFGHYVTGLREPNLDALLRICRALGCSPNDLLNWDGHTRRLNPHEKLETRLVSAARTLSRAHLETLVVQAEALAAVER